MVEIIPKLNKMHFILFFLEFEKTVENKKEIYNRKSLITENILLSIFRSEFRKIFLCSKFIRVFYSKFIGFSMVNLLKCFIMNLARFFDSQFI
jgi:hypothetical protein